MRTLALSLWCGLVAMAWAAPDGPTSTAPTVKGKVAVLDNHQLIEGDIEKVGDQIRIRRTIGETWLPASRIVHIGPDRLDAYAYLVRKANLRDADERIRLARWCLGQSLRPQALNEAKAALALRPNDADIRLMVRALEQMNAQPPRPEPMPVSTPTTTEVVEEPPTPPDFNTDAMTSFVTRIQPILMNTCAACHAQPNTKSFKLVRVFEGVQNRRATQQNLAATLAMINREDVLQSPLLVKSLLPHGDSPKPPIRDRQTPMFRLLETWARFAIARPGGGIEDYQPATPVPVPMPMVAPNPAPSDVVTPAQGFQPVQPIPAVNSGFGELRGAPASLPKIPIKDAPKTPGEGDPFDPAIFNGPMK